MTAKPLLLRSIVSILLLAPFAASPVRASTADMQSDSLVKRALASELRNARDIRHPMRYRLRKASPRLTSTKEIFETMDGAVARLVEINDRPLSQADEQKEQARLDGLLSDPSRQSHRKQAEEDDAARAIKVLRALPQAFIYRFVDVDTGPTGKLYKYNFWPNPDFDPPDLETQVLKAMSGAIWIDPAQVRVARLEGHLTKDVNFGWGILGRLNKGGWIVIAQEDVGERQWRIVRFQMVMSGRVLFKSRTFDTVQEQSHFTPVPVGLTYAQAIGMLRAGPPGSVSASR